METPAYDPRGFYGITLAYSVSKRGGCHRKAFCSDEAEGQISGLEIDSKPRLVVNQEIKSAWVDSLGVCKWATGGLQARFYPDIIYALTGETISDDDLKLIGERAINLAQISIGNKTTEDKMTHCLGGFSWINAMMVTIPLTL